MLDRIIAMLPVSAARHRRELKALESKLKQAQSDLVIVRYDRDRLKETIESERAAGIHLAERMASISFRPDFKDRSGVVQVMLDSYKLAALLSPSEGDRKDPLRDVLCDHIGRLVSAWLKRAVFAPVFLPDGRDSGRLEPRVR